MQIAHSHAHAGHTHGVPPRAEGPGLRLWIILGLTLTFMLVEAAGGILSGSLALLADAGHMLSDTTAIGLSLFALWLGGRETSRRHTFGFRRAEFLAAFVNSMGLVVLAVWIVVEAIQRIGSPRAVLGGVMFWVALAGLLVNVAGLLILHGHAEGNLNVKSALWHIMGDLLGSLGAVGAAIVIQFTGWTPIDPILSIGIALLIGLGGGRILYDSASLLMDKVPSEIDTEAVRQFLADYPEVEQICDLHIWSVSSNETMLTAHVVVGAQVERDRFLRGLLAELQARFNLAHMTVQIESEPQASCPDAW
ncbi:MAG TPA: cation diffusion facilitator family transporter [bacterium]|nr:cation diffusion facilitator family transporter [bacterium]